MTTEQAGILAKYRINHDEADRLAREDWQLKLLAIKIVRDAGKHMGEHSDANT